MTKVLLVSQTQFRHLLVGGLNHLEKYYSSQLGRVIPYMIENEIHVPNHQPVYLGKL